MDLDKTKIPHLSLEEDSGNHLIMQLLEKELLAAQSPEEVEMYLAIYREIVKQKLLINTVQHQQFMDRFQIIRQTSIWGIIISIGIGLIISRLSIPGLILIGLVFYDFVFDYHKFRKNHQYK